MSALDARVRSTCASNCALQKRLSITTLMVTHDQEEAMAMADRQRTAASSSSSARRANSTASPARPSSPTSWARPTGCRSSASTRTAPAWAVRNWPWTRRWAPRPAACSCARGSARQRRAAEQPNAMLADVLDGVFLGQATAWPCAWKACPAPPCIPSCPRNRRRPAGPHAASRCWVELPRHAIRAYSDAGSAPPPTPRPPP